MDVGVCVIGQAFFLGLKPHGPGCGAKAPCSGGWMPGVVCPALLREEMGNKVWKKIDLI